MEQFQPPKGTRDFYPQDQYFQEYLFSQWHKTCRRYGFEPYDGPIFEHLSLFTQKSGDEIEKQLYAFQDKKGRMLALRPEITPTLARMIAGRGNELKRPVRWYSIARVFRYEKMQRGRLREFFQLNMDIIGIAEVTADAELIAAAVDTMRDLGLSDDDFLVRISSRRLLEQALRAVGVPAEQLCQLYALLDKRAKLPPEVFTASFESTIPDAALRHRINDVFAAQTLKDVSKITADSAAVGQLEELFGCLDAYGIGHVAAFDIGVVRGLAYYTGIVFEIFDKQRSMRAIAGGGRYDHLVSSYGGPDTPAVGFAVGDVVLGELLRAKGCVPQPPARTAVYVVTMGAESIRRAIQLATTIRTAGISCEFAMRQTAIGKQFKLADAAGARLVVIEGDKERAQAVVKIKDMRSGEELTTSSQTMIEKIQRLRGA